MNSIEDPILYDVLRNEQKRIYEKKANEQQFQGRSRSSNAFDKNFGGIEGSGDDLPNF